MIVRDGAVTGVELKGHDEPLEADEVVVNAPVWDIPQLFDDGALPWDWLQRVKLLANNKNKACWIGYWIAAEEPVIASSELEMASFFATPRTGLPGFTLNFTGYDPGVSPKGEYLTCFGAAFDATQHYGDRALAGQAVRRPLAGHRGHAPGRARRAVEEAAPRDDVWRDLQARDGRRVAAGRDGARRRRAVGDRRHDPRARDRRRQGRPLGLTTAEAVLGRRLDFFADSVRY